MLNKYNEEFWESLDSLIASGKIIIDRPRGSTHPRFPECRYEVDYGYIEDTTSMDGGGIDLWLGSLVDKKLNAIICTVDLMKKDSEIKLLIGCSDEEMKLIYEFHNRSEYMKGILIRRNDTQ